MRSAIGNSLLMSLVVTIVSVVIILFVSTFSYSKAYKIKNGIIEIIEKYGVYEGNEAVHNEIATYLSEVGYQLGNCDEGKVTNNIAGPNETKGYKYCVEADYENPEASTNKEKGYRKYRVTTYVEFNFPKKNKSD